MCGVVGMFGPGAGERVESLEHAVASLHHRGPDGRGIYVSPDGRCVLGHTRLSILDLSPAGHQPMERGTSVLCYNGEIYNHRELREPLGGTTWRGSSDTETLLELLRGEGDAVFPLLTGMFAGAYWDGDRGRLLLFRDSLGIKPLYRSTGPGNLVLFASEIEALRILGADAGTGHLDAVRCYLTYENLAPGMSAFAGIHPLDPGELRWLSWDEDRGRVEERQGRFRPVASEQKESGEEPVVRVRGWLSRSVERHLLSDVPLACYMSGGVDSTAVSALAVKERGADLIAFTGYFETGDDHYDERPVARAAAEAFGVPLREIPIRPADFERCCDDLVRALEEPRMGMGSFSQYVVAEAVSRERKVVLAGHGGDELFWGYPMHRAVAWLESETPGPKLSRFLATPSKQKAWLAWAAWSRCRHGSVSFAPHLSNWFAGDLGPAVRGRFSGGAANEGSLAEQLDRYYREVYLPGLLWVEDRISMRHSLETRLPLWSQPLCDQAFALSPEERMRGGEPKGLLREAVRGLLPDAVLNAPKRGFPTPLRLWFRRELADFVSARLLDSAPSSPLFDLLPRSSIESLLRDHRTRPLPFALDERRAHRIWMLVFLESWLRQFQVRSFA